jgi:hypothetical protein
MRSRPIRSTSTVRQKPWQHNQSKAGRENDGLWKARKTMVLFSAFPQALESQIDSNIITSTTNTSTEQVFHLKNRKYCLKYRDRRIRMHRRPRPCFL